MRAFRNKTAVFLIICMVMVNIFPAYAVTRDRGNSFSGASGRAVSLTGAASPADAGTASPADAGNASPEDASAASPADANGADGGNGQVVPGLLTPDHEPHEHDDIEFTPWGDTEAEQTSLPDEGGEYYLTHDIILDETWEIMPGDVFSFCLNGHKIEFAAEVLGNRLR